MKKISFCLPLILLLIIPPLQAASSTKNIDSLTRKAPEFSAKQLWVQGELDGKKAFEKKITLIYFWDYSTVNCIRELSTIKALSEAYEPFGLQVVFVHAPEFEFGHKKENVLGAIKRYEIVFPVMMDNDSLLWDEYDNRSWPTKHLVNNLGHIVKTQVGEGKFIEMETAIRDEITLLKGKVKLPERVIFSEQDRFNVWECGEMSTEIYAGHKRAAWWGVEISNEMGGDEDEMLDYEDSGRRLERGIFLQGRWANREEYIEHGEGSADYLGIIYLGTDVYGVLGQLRAGERAKVYVFRDRVPVPEEYRGLDLQEDEFGNTFVWVEESRLYYLIENENSEYHEMKLLTKDPGFAVYVFSFSNRCLNEFERL